MVLYSQELARLLIDALISVEVRHISFVAFYDCSGGDFGSLMGMMECELLSREGEGVRHEEPPTPCLLPLYCTHVREQQTCKLQETS